MARDIEHIIDAADDPEIAILVAPRAVPCEIAALDLAPILFLETGIVAVNGAQHGWPGFSDDELAALVGSNLFAIVIHDRGVDAEKWKRGGTRLERGGAGQRGDHLHTGFGLPPGVDDWAASAADVLIIPHPRFRVDRFADGAEQSEGGEVMLRGPFVAPFHEGADGSRCGVENGDAVVGDDAPEAVWLRPVRSAFVHESGCAIGQGAVDDVAVTCDPADVGGAPEGVLLAEIENVF